MYVRQRLLSQAPYLLSVLRIVIALLFIEHGSMKLLGFPPSSQASPLTLLSLEGLSGALELVGGLLLLPGLFTRAVAFVLSGEMAAAYFIAHASKSFFPALNKGETALIYSFLFLYLALPPAVAPGASTGCAAWAQPLVRRSRGLKSQESKLARHSSNRVKGWSGYLRPTSALPSPARKPTSTSASNTSSTARL